MAEGLLCSCSGKPLQSFLAETPLPNLAHSRGRKRRRHLWAPGKECHNMKLPLSSQLRPTGVTVAGYRNLLLSFFPRQEDLRVPEA